MTKQTRVFICENGRKLYGTIESEKDGVYTIRWDDGEVTREPVNEFNPAGWV